MEEPPTDLQAIKRGVGTRLSSIQQVSSPARPQPFTEMLGSSMELTCTVADIRQVSCYVPPSREAGSQSGLPDNNWRTQAPIASTGPELSSKYSGHARKNSVPLQEFTENVWYIHFVCKPNIEACGRAQRNREPSQAYSCSSLLFAGLPRATSTAERAFVLPTFPGCVEPSDPLPLTIRP